ncbi:hypothetical protein R1flu_003151 [Riccia fluitans]|uniref:Uncharacterized protein n=1 Tax=Riccia fluitans TaxID=41844 RepID=A0ABD1Y891_9MARC
MDWCSGLRSRRLRRQCVLYSWGGWSNVIGDTKAAARFGFFKWNSASACLARRSIPSELAELPNGEARDSLLQLSNSLEHVLFDHLVGTRLLEAQDLTIRTRGIQVYSTEKLFV